MKKIFIFFILIIILSSAFMISAATPDVSYSDITDSEMMEKLEVLSAYEIIKGYVDGTMRPTNFVTNAEAAKVLAKLLGRYNYIENISSKFDDMHGHWAEGYAQIIDYYNIVEPAEKNMFKPKNYITYNDSVRAVMRILGYNSDSFDYRYYNETAKKIGLLDGVTNSSFYITREEFINLIYNAFDKNFVNIVSNKIVPSNRKLFDNLGDMETQVVDYKIYKNNPQLDLSNYVFNKCDVYYNLSGKVVLVRNPQYKSLNAIVKSSLASNTIFVDDGYGNIKMYNLKDVPVIFNGVLSLVNDGDLNGSRINLVFNDDEILGASAKKVTDVLVVNEYKPYISGQNTLLGKYLPYKSGNIAYENLEITGDVDKLEDIQKNDVVYFYETKESSANSRLKIEVVRKHAIGRFVGNGSLNYKKFITISDSKTNAINDKSYIVSEFFKNNEDVKIGDIVDLILDKEGNVIAINILEYVKEPETFAFVKKVVDGSNGLPYVEIINEYGKSSGYYLKENSGTVNVTIVDGNPIYYTEIKANDIIKYDLYDNSIIKIAKPMQSYSIKGEYDLNSGVVGNTGYRINQNTSIIQINNGRYNKIYSNGLGYYIEGKVCADESRNIDFFILTKNIEKTVEEGYVVEEKTDKESFTGTLYGMIESIETSKAGTFVKLYNNQAYVVKSSIAKEMSYYKNQFIRLSIKDNIVSGVSAFTPEIMRCKITGVYSSLFQIDKISYVEYASDAKVYVAKTDQKGNISSFKVGSIRDVAVNSIVSFYNLSNNYNGVMDTIIVYK